jgi:hypothetical protein
MKTLVKLFTVTVAIFSLSACKQAQLDGPVMDADILIDLLNQPGAGFQQLETTDVSDVARDIAPTLWTTLTENQKRIRLGVFEVDEELIVDELLYFVTARNGEESDADRDGEIERDGPEVLGEWHAIMGGATLLNDCALVSALTEAAYQYVRDRIGVVSDKELLSLLDEFAGLVIADVNFDGVVNYTDVLLWSRYYFEASYLGDIAFLDALANAIASGADDYVVRAAAESVWLNEFVMPVRPSTVDATTIGGDVSGDLVLLQSMSPYSVNAGMTITGDLIIEPGVWVRGNGEQLTVQGDLHIEGLPRLHVTLDDVALAVATSANRVGSLMRYTDIDNGRLLATVPRMIMSDNTLKDSRFEFRVGRITENNQVLIRDNTLDETRVTFTNNQPPREPFVIDFSNNLFIPSDTTASRLTSKWEGAVVNLMVKNNSFHPNMRILRSGYSAVFNVADNYWGDASVSEINFDEIIPDQGRGEDGEEFSTTITYSPVLRKPAPDTPVAPD